MLGYSSFNTVAVDILMHHFLERVEGHGSVADGQEGNEVTIVYSIHYDDNDPPGGNKDPRWKVQRLLKTTWLHKKV